MSEGRFQTALDVAKQLAKSAPTDENRRRLVDCYLRRGIQLIGEGRAKDAQTVLEVGCEQARENPALLVRFAEEFARSGDINRALALVEWLPEPRPATRVPAFAADAALQRGVPGRELLPETMRADFDRVRTAFDHSAKGEDDAARESLQGIGLASPFLEWKLMLRGLLAYYLNDDARAIENWSRLDATRAPWRLVAAQRAEIDPEFLRAQPPATQVLLRQRVERAANDPLAAGLRAVQSALVTSRVNLMPAFRAAEAVVPVLRQLRPEMIVRLARCFYWEVIENGQPEDRGRYQRLFGVPSDDPEFAKLTAIVMEHGNNWPLAHQEWQLYEKSLDRLPTLTDVERQRLRAMILLRMGRNAERHSGAADVETIMLAKRQRPTPLRPNAEECFRRAVAIAPNWLEAHVALVETFAVNLKRKQKEAIAVAEALLAQFPDHEATLEILAHVYAEANNLDRAAALNERLLAVNPLDPRRRIDLARIRRRLGIEHMRADRFAEARAAFESAMSLHVDKMQSLIAASWAICEFKAGDASRAEELLRQAYERSYSGNALVDGWMFAFAVALKLPKGLKARFETPFKAALDAASPAIPDVVALLTLYTLLKAEGIAYYGSKAHQKKAIDRAAATYASSYPENMVDEVGFLLIGLDAWKALRKLTGKWRREFPRNPFPLYFDMEYVLANSDRHSAWKLLQQAERSKALAEAMPASTKRDMLIKMLDLRIRVLRDSENPLEFLFGAFGDRGPIDEFDREGRW